jgi:hypothetical protein
LFAIYVGWGTGPYLAGFFFFEGAQPAPVGEESPHSRGF